MGQAAQCTDSALLWGFCNNGCCCSVLPHSVTNSQLLCTVLPTHTAAESVQFESLNGTAGSQEKARSRRLCFKRSGWRRGSWRQHIHGLWSLPSGLRGCARLALDGLGGFRHRALVQMLQRLSGFPCSCSASGSGSSCAARLLLCCRRSFHSLALACMSWLASPSLRYART
jgi:hypothetical protein